MDQAQRELDLLANLGAAPQEDLRTSFMREVVQPTRDFQWLAGGPSGDVYQFYCRVDNSLKACKVARLDDLELTRAAYKKVCLICAASVLVNCFTDWSHKVYNSCKLQHNDTSAGVRPVQGICKSSCGGSPAISPDSAGL